jgi:hypothetical protein
MNIARTFVGFFMFSTIVAGVAAMTTTHHHTPVTPVRSPEEIHKMATHQSLQEPAILIRGDECELNNRHGW